MYAVNCFVFGCRGSLNVRPWVPEGRQMFPCRNRGIGTTYGNHNTLQRALPQTEHALEASKNEEENSFFFFDAVVQEYTVL